MSTEALGGSRRTARLWRLPAAIASAIRFFRAIIDSHRAETELNGLSDRYLHDIGVDRRQISEVVQREIARSQLLDAGWRGSPRR